jgi:multiple sugar transport system substrate-binding protein
MKPRILYMLISLAVLALLVAGCPAPGVAPSVPPGQATAEAGVVPAQKVQVKLATWAGVDEANELQVILDRLNEASDTYEIVQESSPAEYWTKIQTTVAAGTAADLMWMDQEHLPDFASRGALMDITDRLQGDTHPAADLDDYFPAALERYTYDGRHYGLPWIAMPVMLYVNLDSLEAAGYSAEDVNDWTWNDFSEACVAMTQDAAGNTPNDAGFDATTVRQYGFSIVPGWPPVQMWIWQAGGDVINEARTEAPIDSPEAIQGAQYIADLVATGCTPAQSVISERGFGEMMKAGQVAMFMGGAADDFERTEGMQIQAFMLPQGPVSRDTWAWIGGMSVNANTGNPEAAYQAFVDLSQAIQEWKVPAPRQSLATAEGIVAATPYKAISADNIIANMENMRAPQIFPGYAQWATVFGERYVDPLVRGNATAEELSGTVRILLEEVLADTAQ